MWDSLVIKFEWSNEYIALALVLLVAQWLNIFDQDQLKPIFTMILPPE